MTILERYDDTPSYQYDDVSSKEEIIAELESIYTSVIFPFIYDPLYQFLSKLTAKQKKNFNVYEVYDAICIQAEKTETYDFRFDKKIWKPTLPISGFNKKLGEMVLNKSSWVEITKKYQEESKYFKFEYSQYDIDEYNDFDVEKILDFIFETLEEVERDIND